eukprot:COSAG06_NODE_6220_length_3039_cov_34.856803_2_plen_59_part_00
MITREVRDCLGYVVRAVIQEVDPDQAVNVRTYLQLRGLGAWVSHITGFLNVRCENAFF